MPSTLPLLTVRGRVRAAEVLAVRSGERQGEVYGTRVTILTEPNGGFLEALVYAEKMAPAEVEQLVGEDVEALVSLGVYVSPRGSGFLQAQVEKLEAWLPESFATA